MVLIHRTPQLLNEICAIELLIGCIRRHLHLEELEVGVLIFLFLCLVGTRIKEGAAAQELLGGVLAPQVCDFLIDFVVLSTFLVYYSRISYS
jgi:hypothetical protein